VYPAPGGSLPSGLDDRPRFNVAHLPARAVGWHVSAHTAGRLVTGLLTPLMPRRRVAGSYGFTFNPGVGVGLNVAFMGGERRRCWSDPGELAGA